MIIKMDEFIKTLTEQIRCVKAREGVARELSDHILDQAGAYEESGIEHDKAVEMAVHGMGDPVEIGISLDRIHRPQMNWKMLLIIFILSSAGLLIMYCVYGNSTILSKQAVFTVLGFAVIMAVNFADYSVLGRFGYVPYILLTVALLIGKSVFPYLNGRQPSMAMLPYLYVPVFAGILYRLRGGGYGSIIKGILMIGVTSILAVQFSSNILVGANIFLIMNITLLAAVRKNAFSADKKIMTIIILAITVMPAICTVFLCMGYRGRSFRIERLRSFFMPERYPETSGYIYMAARSVLSNLRFIGHGNGVNGYDEVVSTSNSMIPLCIMYSYGLIFGILLLLLFAAFIMAAAKVVRSQKNQFGALVSLSSLLVIFLNCFEGILMNLGLYPVTNISIPFITFGGSVAFVYSVLIGLLMSVHRYENVITDKTKKYESRYRLSIKLERR